MDSCLLEASTAMVTKDTLYRVDIKFGKMHRCIGADMY